MESVALIKMFIFLLKERRKTITITIFTKKLFKKKSGSKLFLKVFPAKRGTHVWQNKFLREKKNSSVT